MLNMSSIPDDRTARAVIRDEALRLFREARISSDVFDRLRRDIDAEATRIER